MTMSKEDIIKIAEMNIDDLKKQKLKKIFTCLGITAAIVGGVAAANFAGMDNSALVKTGAIAMAANSGIASVTVQNVFVAHTAIKTAKEGLEKFERGDYDMDEYYNEFLKGAVEFAGKTLEEMEAKLEQSKGVAM